MLHSILQNKKYQIFIQSVVLFLLIAKLFSHNLWLADRVFPTAPPFDFLYNVPNLVHTILYISSIACFLICVAKPSIHRLLPTIIILEIASCLLDQNRWQPWEYQYVFMLFVLWYNKKNEELASMLLIVIISSTYIYSGLQKFNPHYITLVWKKIFMEDFFRIPQTITNQVVAMRLGYIIPLFEMSFGISLFIKRTRKFAIVSSIAMHILLMLVVGPGGVNYNLTVWSWNIAMVVFLLLLWNSQVDFKSLKKVAKPSYNWLPLVAWAVLPKLNFFGYWDFFLSSSLYSGRVDVCFIKLANPPPNFILKKYYKVKATGDTSHIETIAMQTWTMDELDTPPYPQKRMYKKIKKQWLKKYPDLQARFLIVNRSTNKKIVEELQ